MRHAGHERIVSTIAVIIEPADIAPLIGLAATAACELDAAPVAAADPPEAHVVLSPEGTFLAESTAAADFRNERHRHLVIAIRQRIESRLAGRVRDLAVRIVGETVVLEGKCATYYTKQLAQHAALAILEHEQLENAIVVAVPR